MVSNQGPIGECSSKPADNKQVVKLQRRIQSIESPVSTRVVWKTLNSSLVQDREYFVNLSSGVTTFDVKTVAR